MNALANTQVKTDANGYLLVTISGGTITPTTVNAAGAVNSTTGTFQAAGAAFPSGTVGPASPTGTTSTTLVMAGLAGAITTQTGRIVLSMSGYLTDNTANDGTKAQMSYGTGTAPINGAALTGTQVGPVVQFNASTLAAGASAPYAAMWVITGLTKNTAYWFDTAFAAITGGTGALVQASMVAYDIP